jgi:transcription initiation factor TFIIB
VGAEWRTFVNGEAPSDPSRVCGPENPLFNGPPQSTMIGPGRGSASFDEFGVLKYRNRTTVSNTCLYYQSCIFIFMLVFFM